MILETVVFTALPTRRVGSDLYFSVLISPQLGGEEGSSRRLPLSSYPDFRDGGWASIVRDIDWQLVLRWSADDSNEQFFDARRVSGDPDPDLAALLFPRNMPVVPFAFDDPGRSPILSCPTGRLAEVLDAVQLSIARQSPLDRPVARSLVSGKASGTSAVLDGFVLDPSSRVQADAAIDAQLAQGGVTKGPASMDTPGRRLSVQMLHRVLAPTAIDEELAKALTWPELDFHQAVSLLGAHPNLLRRLGLLVDLVAPVRALRRNEGVVRVYPYASWPPPYDPDATGVDITTIFPRVLTSLGPALFRPRPRSDSLTQDGFVALGGVRAITSNVESEVLAHESLATGLARMYREERDSFGTPERSGTPARHSGGIEIVRSDLAAQLKARWQSLAPLRDTMVLGDDTDIGAEEVQIGHRIDVRRKGSSRWSSLHRRNGTLTPYAGTAARPSVDLGDDEGWVEPVAIRPTKAAGLGALRVRESLGHWTGWSLSLPEPGRSLQPDNQAGDGPTADEARAVIDTLHAAIDYASPAGGARLLPLRFSDKPYEFRMRWVDLGGNSLDPTSEGGPILEVPYMRHDPVASPPIFLGDDPVWGESVAVVVLRTGVTGASARTSSVRYVAPPQVSAALCLAHGVFDDADGRPAENAYDLIADRETASLGMGESEILRNPPSAVPYLPDPIVETYHLRGVPTAGGTYDGEFSLPAGGTWPDKEVVGLRFSSNEPNGARRSGRNIIIGLVPGRVAHLRLSHGITRQGLRVMDLWRRCRAAGVGNESQARRGQWWQLTPDRLIVVVHAVQRPVSPPKFVSGSSGAWRAQRRVAETSALISGELRLDVPSTESVDILANRTFAIDGGPGAPPPRVMVKAPMGVVGTSTIADPGPGGAVADSAVTAEVRAALPDTRRALLTLTARAKSRFADYFRLARTINAVSGPIPLHGGQPVAEGTVRMRYDASGTTVSVAEGAFTLDPSNGSVTLRDDVDPSIRVPEGITLSVTFVPDPITRASTETAVPASQRSAAVPVPSSARPLAPQVEQVLPSFAWSNPDGPLRSKREGGTLRIYLARPWFTSGIDEDLAVVLLPTGRREVMEARDALVTQWGLDPVARTGALPVSGHPGFPTRTDFIGGTYTAGVRLAEVSAPVDVLRFPVGAYNARGAVSGFDAERDMWYLDLRMKPGAAYRPFVRLALARYQASSVDGLDLSPVTLLDVAQIEPDRLAAVSFPGGSRGSTVPARVTMSGPSYIRNVVGDGPAKAFAILERYDGPTGSGVDSSRSAAWTEVGRAPLRGGVNSVSGAAVWVGTIDVPRVRPRGKYRIVVEEFEVHRADGSNRPLPTNQAQREARLGQRLVHQDIISI